MATKVTPATSPSSKQRFGQVLWRLAEMEDADSPRRSFRARAYATAVWSLDSLSDDLTETAHEVQTISGIGAGVAGLLEEFVRTGTVRRFQTLQSALPVDSRRLRGLPRMTPARLRWLKQRGVDTVADLTAAIAGGVLEDMPGVGEATAALWGDRLDMLGEGEMTIVRAVGYATRWAHHLESHLDGSRSLITGSLRRLDEIVDAVELLIIDGEGVGQFLARSALVTAVHSGTAPWRVATLGGDMLVHTATTETAGSALVATTGPDEHVAELEPLPRVSAEPAVYENAGWGYVPPPARSARKPPAGLMTQAKLMGDLHVHSDWSSDGRQSLAELAQQAAERYQYIAVTDHAQGLRFGGLSVDDLKRQRPAIDEVQAQLPDLAILQGAELNIARDGSLDYPDDVLAWLDFRLASVHSFFDLDVVEQTQRLLRVVENPLVHAIGHLTGRRIGVRPGIRLDFDAVFEAAAGTSTALEVNGHLDRLDLSAELSEKAADHGVLFLANSDSHRPREAANVANAVGVLQRAHVQAERVVNTWDRARFLRWVEGG